MSVQVSSSAVSIYWQHQTENLGELLKKLVRNIRYARRRYRVQNEYDRLNDPIISKAYSTMLTTTSPWSDEPKRHFLR